MRSLEDASRRFARYHCTICLRPFDRKDTLSRHMQIHDRQSRPRSRRKACNACCQSKTRCDGERPACGSCVRRGQPCVYRSNPRAERTGASSSSRRAQDTIGTHAGSNVISTDGRCEPPMQETTDLLSPLQDEQEQQHQSHDLRENIYFSPATSESEQQNSQWQTLLTIQDQDTSPFDQTLLYPTFDGRDFNSNLDWILDQNTMDQSFADIDLTMFSAGDIIPKPMQAQSISDSHEYSGIMANQPIQNLQEGYRERIEEIGPSDSLGGIIAPEPRDVTHPTGPWPAETPTKPLQHLRLPALGSKEECHQRHFIRFPASCVTEHVRAALRKCLFLPFENNSIQSLCVDDFPSIEELEHCIDLYLAHFHPVVPVIHQPTFDSGKDLVVTLAMICIGSCYTNFENAKVFAACLSELTGRLLDFMANHDRRFIRTPSYLTAQILQGTHGYGSGSERLFELSESTRGTLTQNAKSMGLFRYDSKEIDISTLTTHSAWHAWIDAERLRRLGWAVYKYDASVAYLHNTRPFLSVGDINLRLPSSEERWAAESAYAWAALRPWSQHSVEKNSRLRTTLRTLFDGTENPAEKIDNEEHAFIIVLTLLRMLWSLKEIRSSPIADLTAPPAYEDGSQSLLEATRKMAVSLGALSHNYTSTEIYGFVHRMQLVHIAHVYGACDLMNWLYPYLRQGQEGERATQRMKQWALEDTKRTREVAYRCAQLLGLLRHYPTNSMMEPFIIFHAGVVLSCVALLLPRQVGTTGQPALQLDVLDHEGTRAIDQHNEWVSNGSHYHLNLNGVPNLCCSEGRRSVLEQTAMLLKRRKVWGMAQNMTKIVMSLRSRADDEIC